MARVVRFHRLGGPEVLQVEELTVAPPAAGEVLISVSAIGLNRVEALYRSGSFGEPPMPSLIGYEAAGTIAAVGEGVSNFAVGERVAVLPGLDMASYGTYGELIRYPAEMVVKIPASQTFEQAAATWMQYLTAYALVDVADIDAGDFVVINAASSSVGIAAMQIANAHGAVPIAVTRGRDKVAGLQGCGAAHVIVSDEEDVAARIMEITAGQGARIAFDAVAGPGLAALLTAMAPMGVVIVYGTLGGYSLELMLPPMMLNNLTLRGFAADMLVKTPESRQRVVTYITDGLARGALKPVIDRVFVLDDIAAAHSYMAGGTQMGKIIVTTGVAGD